MKPSIRTLAASLAVAALFTAVAGFGLLDALGPKAVTGFTQRDEKYYVDLKFCNALWLQRAGIGQLDISPDCTRCNPDRYWSHRATGGRRGSLAGIIMLK